MMKRAQKKTNWTSLFSICLITYTISTILSSHFVYANSMDITFFTIAKYFALTIFSLKIILIDLKKYSKKNLIYTALIMIILLLSAYTCKSSTLLQLFIIILAARNIDFNLTVKNILFWQGLLIAIIILLSIIGVIPDRLFDRAGNIGARHSLGFKYSTGSAYLVWILTVSYLYIRKNKLKFIEYLILIIINTLIFIYTDTRAAFGFSIIAIAAFFFLNHLHDQQWVKKIFTFLVKYLIYILSTISILLMFFYSPQVIWMKDLNTFSSNRLYLNSKNYQEYGLTPFGSNIKSVGLAEIYEGEAIKNDFNVIDSSYIGTLLNYGYITFALFMFIYAFFSKRLIIKGDLYLQAIWIILIINAFFNPHLLRIVYNPFILMFTELLFSKNEKRSNNESSTRR